VSYGSVSAVAIICSSYPPLLIASLLGPDPLCGRMELKSRWNGRNLRRNPRIGTIPTAIMDIAIAPINGKDMVSLNILFSTEH
jgi:hypothetical protein